MGTVECLEVQDGPRQVEPGLICKLQGGEFSPVRENYLLQRNGTGRNLTPLPAW